MTSLQTLFYAAIQPRQPIPASLAGSGGRCCISGSLEAQRGVRRLPGSVKGKLIRCLETYNPLSHGLVGD